jgi:hypothetical protein
MDLEKAMAILSQAPTILLFDDELAEACKLAVQAMVEQQRREAGKAYES